MSLGNDRKAAGQTVGVVCAYNEAENITRAVRTFRSVASVDEVLVVDGGSADATVRRAEAAGARVVEQRELRYPGKGIAVRTALEETDAPFLVFFDADIHNMEAWQVDRLVRTVAVGGADHAVASFTRAGGRVTELTAKPLLSLFFPEVRLRQPLAGEFATRRDILSRFDIVPDWGVESGLVIDLAMTDANVVEVDTGHKEHPMKPLAELGPMADQVARTIVQKAVEYGRLSVPEARVEAVEWLDAKAVADLAALSS